eukprot:CAMPEP_0198263138 /NCGR_PEP_ID=MMETSP1447-20131203/11543_1 /TAXON_ID=420782 /ORGANISM="Chaetoceros dichaeta, Strain CCMP1751" /LENGTH=721 /DNA_ID=CAMNT_0043951627 /DNA_START=406 /DNA_END=2571 /DNA_ORIENTATION=-
MSPKRKGFNYDRLSTEDILAPNEFKSEVNITTKSILTGNIKLIKIDEPQYESSGHDHNTDDENEQYDSFVTKSLHSSRDSISLSSSSSATMLPLDLHDMHSRSIRNPSSIGSLRSMRRSTRRRGATLNAFTTSMAKASTTRSLLLQGNNKLAKYQNELATSEPMMKTVPLRGLSDRSNEFCSLVRNERVRDWMATFRGLDPRYQILKFFNDVAREGAAKIEEVGSIIRRESDVNPLLRSFNRASAFSVWRPTSKDAIKKMMTGEATGKGLDVKGKSAKKGKLSGFIPFLQIHDEKHKKMVRWPPKEGSIRIYYKSEALRNQAVLKLTAISNEMETNVFEAKLILSKACANRAQVEAALQNLVYDVTDSKVHLMDDYSPLHYGIKVSERAFFEAYIMREDITRCPEYCTGRPSEPAFQDMNCTCVRKFKGKGPRAVVLQLSETVDDSLCSRSLVVAYEEHGRVTPVVSDFDCFLVGTRGVNYETPLSNDQVEMLKWLLTQIESILESPSTSKSWTSRWLEVLKESADKGFCPETPEYGYGDPKSYAIMKNVVGRLKSNGAVRHGAECFNYGFPQELDNEFLVICDCFESKVPWKYVNVKELQEILLIRIDMGMVFPLSPKWILADHGWKAVYDKMMRSTDKSIKKSLGVWYPPNIRELIEDIYKRFPNGFQRLNAGCSKKDEKTESTEAMDLAKQQLKRHMTLQRAKFKLRVVNCLMNMRRK